jgi:RNA polymerase sigma-70 factor, ECF subfamily
MHMLDPALHTRSLDTNGAHARRASAPSAQADPLPDLLLLERARAGDARAIEALIRRYSRRLYRVAHSVLRDEADAEAAVQEAFLAAFGDLNRYELTGKFAAWLTRLAFNQARALRVGRRPAGQPGATRQAGAATAPPTGSEPMGAELGERRELEQAIGALPEVFRTVFVLRLVEGISGVETAASLALHETTVRTRLYRAHRRLAPETVQRARAAPGLFEPGAERCERIVSAVLSKLAHSSMLTISASPP